jgi:hypothetical protein
LEAPLCGFENVIGNERGDRDLDPVFSRAVLVGRTPPASGAFQPHRARDSRDVIGDARLSKRSAAAVRRIAEDPPDRRPIPRAPSSGSPRIFWAK